MKPLKKSMFNIAFNLYSFRKNWKRKIKISIIQQGVQQMCY